jgi:hypothetical protein
VAGWQGVAGDFVDVVAAGFCAANDRLDFLRSVNVDYRLLAVTAKAKHAGSATRWEVRRKRAARRNRPCCSWKHCRLAGFETRWRPEEIVRAVATAKTEHPAPRSAGRGYDSMARRTAYIKKAAAPVVSGWSVEKPKPIQAATV